MKNTEKIYIGKGNQVMNYEMFNVVINLTAAQGQTFTAKNGDTLLKFTFAKTKNPDNFGRTHTAYITTEAKNVVTEPAPAPTKTKKARAKVKPEIIEPSFRNH